jgi:tetratricopeptide (TPR) repeat protein
VSSARVSLLTVLLVILSATRAHADDTATDWKQRGDEAMDAGRAAEALVAYRRAAAIEPSAALEYNVGRALLAVGDFVGALEAFEHYEATAPDELKRKTHRLVEVMADLRSKLSTLTVTTDETSVGTRVRVRGVDVGALPLDALRVNPGRAELRVERDGFEPFSETLDLAAGAAARVHVVLRPERAFARLGIVATPLGAQVLVDGERRGVVPLELELAPGPHRVVLSAPSYGSRAFSLSLARNESRRIDAQLVAESRPITSRWWFWTGAGVLAAGAAIAIAAATIERSPGEGSLGTLRVP